MHPQDLPVRLTEAAIFLVMTLDVGSENTAREVLADAEAIVRSVGFRAPDGQLACVVGIGAGAWHRLFTGARPAHLHPFIEILGAGHTAVSTPGDLLLHIRARRLDLCFELATQLVRRLAGAAKIVDETHGFRYFDERDLLGFVDGTENPTGTAALTAITVAGTDAAFAGGSYVIVQKYLHDTAAWNALAVEEQERVIGRTKLDDMELPENVKPRNSHLALTVIVDDTGNQLQIVRANMPFGQIGNGEFGTYFIAYSAAPAITEQMLRNMFVGKPAGNTDRILDYSTAVTGSLFFAPCAEFFDNLPPKPSSVTGQPRHDRMKQPKELRSRAKRPRDCSSLLAYNSGDPNDRRMRWLPAASSPGDHATPACLPGNTTPAPNGPC